jgi:hypothetical protein
MDAETPDRGGDRSGVCTGERGGRSTRDSLVGQDSGGSCPFHHDVGLERPLTSPNSPNVLDTLEAIVCQVARVAGS